MITSPAIASRSPLAGGTAFGASGAYDRIDGTAGGLYGVPGSYAAAVRIVTLALLKAAVLILDEALPFTRHDTNLPRSAAKSRGWAFARHDTGVERRSMPK